MQSRIMVAIRSAGVVPGLRSTLDFDRRSGPRILSASSSMSYLDRLMHESLNIGHVKDYKVIRYMAKKREKDYCTLYVS